MNRRACVTNLACRQRGGSFFTSESAALDHRVKPGDDGSREPGDGEGGERGDPIGRWRYVCSLSLSADARRAGFKVRQAGGLAATFEPNLTCDNVSFRKEPLPLKTTSAFPKFLLAVLRIYCGVPAKLAVTLRPEKPLRTALPSSKSLLADWAVPQSAIFGYHSGRFEEAMGNVELCQGGLL